MSVVLKDLPQFDAKVNAWFRSVEALAETAAKGVAIRVMGVAAKLTPQYSGTTAANWRISTGSPDTSWQRDPLGTKGIGEPVAEVGDNRAIRHALANAGGKMAGLKLGNTIYITNNTLGSADAFNLAVRLENNEVKLREVNKGYYDMTKRAVRIIGNQYRAIGASDLPDLRKLASV